MGGIFDLRNPDNVDYEDSDDLRSHPDYLRSFDAIVYLYYIEDSYYGSAEEASKALNLAVGTIKNKYTKQPFNVRIVK